MVPFTAPLRSTCALFLLLSFEFYFSLPVLILHSFNPKKGCCCERCALDIWQLQKKRIKEKRITNQPFSVDAHVCFVELG
jgi:hypothetical protein